MAALCCFCPRISSLNIHWEEESLVRLPWAERADGKGETGFISGRMRAADCIAWVAPVEWPSSSPRLVQPNTDYPGLPPGGVHPHTTAPMSNPAAGPATDDDPPPAPRPHEPVTQSPATASPGTPATRPPPSTRHSSRDKTRPQLPGRVSSRSAKLPADLERFLARYPHPVFALRASHLYDALVGRKEPYAPRPIDLAGEWGHDRPRPWPRRVVGRPRPRVEEQG